MGTAPGKVAPADQTVGKLGLVLVLGVPVGVAVAVAVAVGVGVKVAVAVGVGVDVAVAVAVGVGVGVTRRTGPWLGNHDAVNSPTIHTGTGVAAHAPAQYDILTDSGSKAGSPWW